MHDSRDHLTGRDEELARLKQMLTSAREGASALAVIEGEPGIGKTTLLSAALEHACDLGFSVLQGAGEALFPDRPFGPIFDAIRPRLPPGEPGTYLLRELLPRGQPDPGIDAPETRFMLLEHMVSLLEELALSTPVALAMEDVQWADPSTMLTTKSVVKRLHHLPLVVLLTYRSMSESPALSGLLQGLKTETRVHISLGPLKDREVIALAEKRLGLPPGPQLATALKGAGGNPFYVVELLEAVEASGGLRNTQKSVDMETGELPPSLQALIVGRLATLRADAFRLLQIASVFGSTFSLELSARLAGTSIVNLMPSIEEAQAAGLVEPAGDSFVFRHQLVRDAVYSEMPAEGRYELHRKIASLIAQTGGSALSMASHLRIVAKPGETESIQWFQRAAREAASTAPVVAVGLLEQALSLDPDEQLKGSLEEDLIVVLDRVGRLEEAADLARKLIADAPDRETAARARLYLIRALLRAGQLLEAHIESQAGLEEGPENVEPITWARISAESGWGLLATGDSESARSAAEAALRLGREAKDVQASVSANNVLVIVQMQEGDLEAAISGSKQNLQAARAMDSPDSELWISSQKLFIALALTEADRFEEARSCLEEVLAFPILSPWYVIFFRTGLVQLYFLAGRWSDCEAEIGTALSVAEGADNRSTLFTIHTMAAFMAVYRNRLPSADESLARADEEAAKWGMGLRGEWILWVRALLHEARGNQQEALDAMENAWAIATFSGPTYACPVIGPDLVRMALSQDRDCSTYVEQIEEVAARMGTHSASAAALHCRGLAASNPQDLWEAIQKLRDGPRPPQLANALEDTARLVARTDRHGAISCLKEAVSIYDSLGANLCAGRAEASLRSLGVYSGKRGTRRRALSGWDALTETQKRVADLAREGLSRRTIGERLFISTRTVESHLTQIFKKLQVSSRVELVAKLAYLEANKQQASHPGE